MIHCANCFHAKVVFELLTHGKKIHKIRCKKNKWERPHGSRDFRNIYVIRDVHPGVGIKKHTCSEYQSMGDNEQEFLNSLPIDREDYKERWLKRR